MPTTTIPDVPARLATFLDSDPVGLVGVGVIGGFLLFVAFAGLTVLVRGTRKAPAHRPSGGRLRVRLDNVPREPQHRTVDVTQQLTAHPYPAYLGPEQADRAPALAGGGTT